MNACKAALLLLIGLCAARDGAAHEFWVQPDEFWLTPRSELSVTLQVGDSNSRQLSPIPAHRITRFEAIGPTGDSLDLRGGGVRLDQAGTYVVALATDNQAHSHQPAMRFNDYLQMEGLTPALEHRKRTHQMHVDGFERYGRVAKSIVLVGNSHRPATARVTQPLGLKLEIVPQVSPYSQPRPARFPLRILYDGRPLAGALVKLMDLEQDLASPIENLTDVTGSASFRMPKRGSWLLSVVWTKRLDDAADADYETTFASLTFGFPPQFAVGP